MTITEEMFASSSNVEEWKTALTFQKWIKRQNEKVVYTELSLFTEIGGYVGIMLDYSLLNAESFIISLKNVRQSIDLKCQWYISTM